MGMNLESGKHAPEEVGLNSPCTLCLDRRRNEQMDLYGALLLSAVRADGVIYCVMGPCWPFSQQPLPLEPHGQAVVRARGRDRDRDRGSSGGRDKDRDRGRDRLGVLSVAPFTLHALKHHVATCHL